MVEYDVEYYGTHGVELIRNEDNARLWLTGSDADLFLREYDACFVNLMSRDELIKAYFESEL